MNTKNTVFVIFRNINFGSTASALAQNIRNQTSQIRYSNHLVYEVSNLLGLINP